MIRSTLTLLFAGAAAMSAAYAAGGATAPLKHQHWHFDGPFGKYDAEAMQRGWQVYSEVCSSCHGLAQVSFRNLGQKGGPFFMESCPAGVPETVDCSNPNDNPVVKAIAENYKFRVADGPDDLGEMFLRNPIPSDRMPGPFANENQARAANAGAYPPDLSLIMKARHHGPDYVYSLLTGYDDAPANFNVAAGQYYNPYFPGDMSQLLKDEYKDAEGHPVEGVEIPYGGVLAMAPPLSDGIVDYADESVPETVEQYARDLSEFLMWAAEPKLEARKKLGFMTIAYLLILAGILYWSYKSIWARADH